ncbi:MAG: hypothetical protein OIF47_03785 [Marinibacterium sp.]|nr:hypothetical protein [Marinibacterium sp.]
MPATAKNPFETTWKKEEGVYAKTLSEQMTSYLRSAPILKKLDAKFKTSNVAEMLDWNAKNISEATKLLRKECDGKLTKVMKGYPGCTANPRISMKKTGKKFLPAVAVDFAYKRVDCGGQKHQLKDKETLRDLSLKYYGSQIYWEVIQSYNVRQLVFGQTLEIPKMSVPENHAATGAKPKSGGTAYAARMLMPEYKVDLVNYTKSQHSAIYPPGVPFMIHLDVQTTGILNVAKKGELPVSFDIKTYNASLIKTCNGIQFQFDGKSSKDSDLLTLTISGAGGAWSFKIAMVDGHSFKLSAPPKKVRYEENGYVFVGTVGLSIVGKIVPKADGLRIGADAKPPWYVLPFAFAAGAALLFFTAGSALNPATNGVLINTGGPGTVPYNPGDVA